VPNLSFQVEGAEAVAFAASPTLALKLRITNADAAEQIHSILLRCQVQIVVTRRRYKGQEQDRLFDLFGRSEEWGRTLRSLLWAQPNLSIPGFSGSTVVDLPLPCSYDFNLAATKYFDALAEGDIPLCLLFSGTVFYAGRSQTLQVAQVPWEKEANFRLPLQAWREVVDLYYPNAAWLELRKDVFDRLREYKSQNGLTTWEQTMESLLEAVRKGVRPLEMGPIADSSQGEMRGSDPFSGSLLESACTQEVSP
jgi:hypothetical protein